MIGFLKRNRLFMRFVLSYLAVLLITIVIGLLTYSEMLKISKEESISHGLLSLEKGKDLVESRFMELDSIISQLALDEEIQSIFNIPQSPETRDYYMFQKIQKKLYSYKINNAFIDDIYVVLEDPKVIVSSRYMSDRPSIFYRDFLQYEGINYSEWSHKLMGAYHLMNIWPSQTVIKDKKSHRFITYVQSYPIGSHNSYKGAVFIQIDENSFNQYFSDLDIVRDGLFMVMNQDGEVISSIHFNETHILDNTRQLLLQLQASELAEIHVNGEPSIVLRTSSDYRYWNYIAVIPEALFEGKTASIKRIFGITVALILIAGFISAVGFAYRNSHPLRKVLERLQLAFNEEGSPSRDFNFLEGTVSKLIDHNVNLREQLAQQMPFIKANFLERLLRGGFHSVQEIQSALNHSGLVFNGDRFIVVVMRVNGLCEEWTEEGLKEMDIARLIVSNSFKRLLGEQAFLHHIDEDRICIILMWKSNDFADLKQRLDRALNKVKDEVNDEYDIKLRFGVGNSYSNALDIPRAYHEASKALEYKNRERDTRTVWFDQIPSNNTGYAYPLDVEMRLINLLKSGNETAVVNEIQSIFKANFVQRRLSESESTQLYFEIRGTIMKVKDEIESEGAIDELLQKMDASESMEELFEKLSEIYILLCSIVNQKKSNKNKELIANIINYIHSNFHVVDMCLYMVASEFELTEKYLSQLFKEHTGENFTAFVESIRLEQAVELMEKTKLSIHEIALKIGYDKINTFYRAFKRVYGLSPTNYRNKLS